MARLTKAERELTHAQELRARAKELLQDPYNDWNDWEFKWLTDETRRHPGYIYSDKEWKVLERLCHNSRSFTVYSGYSVRELIAIANTSPLDLLEGEQEFVETLQRRGATHLKRR